MDIILEKNRYPYGDAQIGLYCPWDVISYCDDLLADPAMPPKNYWANTSENVLVKRFIYKADQTTKDEIEQLINGGIVSKRIKQELTYNELDSSIEKSLEHTFLNWVFDSEREYLWR